MVGVERTTKDDLAAVADELAEAHAPEDDGEEDLRLLIPRGGPWTPEPGYRLQKAWMEAVPALHRMEHERQRLRRRGGAEVGAEVAALDDRIERLRRIVDKLERAARGFLAVEARPARLPDVPVQL